MSISYEIINNYIVCYVEKYDAQWKYMNNELSTVEYFKLVPYKYLSNIEYNMSKGEQHRRICWMNTLQVLVQYQLLVSESNHLDTGSGDR